MHFEMTQIEKQKYTHLQLLHNIDDHFAIENHMIYTRLSLLSRLYCNQTSLTGVKMNAKTKRAIILCANTPLWQR